MNDYIAYAGIAAWSFKLKGEIHSYEDCATFLQDDRECVMLVRERQLGPNMFVERFDGYCAVVLYSTEIIRYYPNGTFSVDNGGHNTPTTRERLQAVLPFGFRCYHFSTQEIKGKLGLIHYKSPYDATPLPKRRRVQTADTLWPLDHSRRITMEGEFA